MKKRLTYFGLTFLGASLLSLAWPPNTLPFLFFIALIPFLYLETFFQNKGQGKLYGLYIYLGLFTFNLLTTWWVWNASPGGAVFMLFANSFLMLLPFVLYRIVKRFIGQGRALFFFVICWLSFEYFHFRWGLAYPWLTLGNGFATAPNIVQWYEYTGVLGGSLWILTINAFIYNSFSKFRKLTTLAIVVGLVGPLVWSTYLKGTQFNCKQATHELLVIQPNIDPYIKFEPGTQGAQIDTFMSLCEAGITENTKLIILPETALVGNMNENFINQDYGVRKLKSFLAKHPNVGMLVGASTHRFYEDGEPLPPYPRYYEPEDKFYDSYNTALQIEPDGSTRTYHKSKLVPGVESLPFPNFFKLFDQYLQLSLGGVSGNLGRDREAKTFHYDLNGTDISIAPLICYESIFGEYVGDFVQQDANIIAVITNDGWWGNTPGHKQHMHYARLRAIEYRRYVVRSANTGISCLIDDNGKIITQLGYEKQGFLRVNAPRLSYTTFYSIAGDYIGKLAVFVFLFLGLSVLVKWINQRRS